MSTPLIDIGLNLTSSRFDKDREQVINDALSANIQCMLITGTNIAESHKALQLSKQYSNLYSTAGVHPHDADKVSADYLQHIIELAAHPKVKAIGECGLDFNRNFSTPENQMNVFAQQLDLAAQLQLPVFLHQRDAFNDWQNILLPRISSLCGGISHCFTGNLAELKQCLDMGFYIGITGWICDPKRGQELYDLAKYIPLDRVMIETDAPYLTPKNIKPKPKSSRNEPKFLTFVARTLAEAMNVDEQLLIEHTSNNAQRLFAFTEQEFS